MSNKIFKMNKIPIKEEIIRRQLEWIQYTLRKLGEYTYTRHALNKQAQKDNPDVVEEGWNPVPH